MSLSESDKRKIGGSDAAAIVGLHPHKTALSVWRRVVEGVDVEENAAMRRGTLLEPVIREMYRLETGAKLLGPTSLRHPSYDFVRASLDDMAERNGAQRVVEYKSASVRVAHRWGTEDDDAPVEHLAQCQWYMGCARLPVADLVVLIGGDELRLFELRADLEFQSMLFEAAERFWKDFILSKRPPPIDGTEECTAWLAARFPRNAGNTITATDDDDRWAEQLSSARAVKEAAEEQERLARNQLVARIGEADGMASAKGWRVSYKLAKGKARTDWEAVCREAAVPDALVQKHTTISAGFRSFRPTFPKEK